MQWNTGHDRNNLRISLKVPNRDFPIALFSLPPKEDNLRTNWLDNKWVPPRAHIRGCALGPTHIQYSVFCPTYLPVLISGGAIIDDILQGKLVGTGPSLIVLVSAAR